MVFEFNKKVRDNECSPRLMDVSSKGSEVKGGANRDTNPVEGGLRKGNPNLRDSRYESKWNLVGVRFPIQFGAKVLSER